jgi:hypothetical protein
LKGLEESMPEKFCPVCKYKNEADAVVCVFCGSPLEHVVASTSTPKNVEMDTVALSHYPEESIERNLKTPPQGIAIYTIDSEIPIAVKKENQFILGRKLTGEMDQSFVDLRPYGAFEHGVSRRHAMIRRTGESYDIIDLGSTNGTWLAKQRIIPNRPYELVNGSRIFLGRLQLILIYQTTVDST